MTDLDILRQYEPIIKFTEGELFFPCAVDEYVKRCGLWLRPPGRGSRPKIKVGELDLDKLAAYCIANPTPPDHSLYLRFVQDPLNGVGYQRWRMRKNRPRFRSSGRLAKVGLFARLVDTFLDLSLMLRGRVPGGTSAAADIRYQEMRQVDPRYVYYGRVVRDSRYIILHYLFFYAMNNWRTSFYGVNDHEADWEQVFVYLLDKEDQPPEPAWVAYASHDFSGDDLRRRWDDLQGLHRQGTHPIIYTGAGSHASYFLPGEYLANVPLLGLKPLFQTMYILQNFWRNVLRQGEGQDVVSQVERILEVPFVDYARGDGFSIGSGGNAQWTPILISDETPWVEHFRGLWGLDTKDPIGGERAPAGPRYNRDGTVRQAWYDPLGWAGLRKVAPQDEAIKIMRQQIIDLRQEAAQVDQKIQQLGEELPELDLEVRALQPVQHLKTLCAKLAQELQEKEHELHRLYARQTELRETLKACQVYLDRLETGYTDPPQAHIHHQHLPESPGEHRVNRFAVFWAAISSGLLLLGSVTLLFVHPPYWVAGLLILLALFAIIDAMLRRQLEDRLLLVTLGLAILTSAVLIYEFFWLLLFVGVVSLSLMIIRDNMRELRSS